MVRIEDIYVGMRLRLIDEPHVYGTIQHIGCLGQKNWLKIRLYPSLQLRLIQKPELWETY